MPPPVATPTYSVYAGRKRRNSSLVPLVLVIAGLAVAGIVASTFMGSNPETPARQTPPGNGSRPPDAGSTMAGKRPAGETADPTASPPKNGRKDKDKDKEFVTPDPRGGKGGPRRPKRGTWSLPNGEGVLVSLVGHRGGVTSAALAPDGEFALSGGEDGTVRLWDLQAKSDLRHFEGGVHGVLHVDFSADGERLLACSGKTNPAAAGMLLIWNTAGGNPSQIDLSKPGVAWDARFSPDGKLLALACNDQSIRLLEATSLQERCTLAGHAAAVRAVAFSELSDRLVSGSDDESVRLWTTADETPGQVFSGHQGAVVAVAFAADGKYIASGSDDRTVRVWSIASGQAVQQWTHPEAVSSVAFTADGLGVLSGCRDGTIRLWRLADGTEAWRYDAHAGGVRSVGFLPGNAHKAITAGADGVVRVWGLPDLRAPASVVQKPAAAPTRVAPPDAAAIAQATKRVKEETFKAEFQAAEKPAAKLDLAKKLLQEASKDDFAPADRYVSLNFARDLAMESNDFETSLAAIDQLDQRFQVLTADMKAATIESIAGNVTQTPRRKALAAKSLQASADAVAADRFDAALRLATLARGLAQKANDGATNKLAESRLNEIDALKQKHQAVQPALGALAANPNDPAANLSAGNYFCFVKGDWSKGLTHWAASADDALKKQAKLDLANPLPTAERLAVGDGWWDLAEKQSGEAREALRRRAAYWYRPIESAVTGLDQTRVKKHLAELDGTAVPGEGAPATTPIKGRDAARAALLRAQGGTEASEAAVAKALDWLARHQNNDGSWNFNHVRAECKDQCPDAGTLDAPQTATGLTLLAFLGAGQSHRAESKSKHQRVVAAGLDYLRLSMARGMQEKSNQHIPPQALATIVLCEASEGGADRTSRGQAAIAAKFLIGAQNADGGWGFQPRTAVAAADASDVGATAWNISALKAAQWAGVVDPANSLKRTGSYLDTATGKTDPITVAQTMLSRIYLGWPRDKQELVDYVGQLGKAGPSTNGRFYANFLQNQVMREAGGAAWPAWNTALRDHLINTQATTGHAAGSWTSSQGDWGNRTGGRLFCTALGALMLEVYYRTPPVYP